MAIKENNVTKHINEILLEFVPDVHYYRPVPGIYGTKHLDYICCIRGQYFVIEAKRPGEDVEPHQADTIREVLTAGGTAFVITGLSNEYAVLYCWLRDVQLRGKVKWRPHLVLPQPKILETPSD